MLTMTDIKILMAVCFVEAILVGQALADCGDTRRVRHEGWVQYQGSSAEDDCQWILPNSNHGGDFALVLVFYTMTIPKDDFGCMAEVSIPGTPINTCTRPNPACRMYATSNSRCEFGTIVREAMYVYGGCSTGCVKKVDHVPASVNLVSHSEDQKSFDLFYKLISCDRNGIEVNGTILDLPHPPPRPTTTRSTTISTATTTTTATFVTTTRSSPRTTKTTTTSKTSRTTTIATSPTVVIPEVIESDIPVLHNTSAIKPSASEQASAKGKTSVQNHTHQAGALSTPLIAALILLVLLLLISAALMWSLYRNKRLVKMRSQTLTPHLNPAFTGDSNREGEIEEGQDSSTEEIGAFVNTIYTW